MTVERWIRLIAGILVLTSVFLALWVNRWWLLLTVFVGVNLAQSAITSWCLMEKILKRLGVKSGGCGQ
ncbi:MAG: DUF2892 domain-containing protein [Candidatus Omnitrophica bacterium]|nr:DUF2892 domain-containing protein [Candidatus Omnitrophota bacterium]MDD5671076.1 DUF2892 domain-containing protein [Candidatus Omnitrophota bacterium]